MLRAASFLRVQTLLWAFLLLVTLPAGAALVFQDDFDDGVVGPEFQPIGGAVLTESGGSLHVQVPDSGGGFSFRLPAPVESTCGFFDGIVLPPSAKGDYINIDLIADDGNGNFVVDSSFRVTRTNSVTISGRDKNGTMHAWKIEDQNPENIVKQWIDKLSGDRRQYEVKFDDGTVWRSPPIDPPDLRIAGYDVTTSMESIEVGQIAAEDEHHPRDQIPVEVDVAIDRLDTLARPNRDGTARTTLAHATVLVGAKLLDITTIDLATVELVSLDGRGNELGRQALDEDLAQKVDGVWSFDWKRSSMTIPADGHLAVEGQTLDGIPFRDAADAKALDDAWGDLRSRGVVRDDSLELTISATGPHQADGDDLASIHVTAIDQLTGPLSIDDLEVSVLVGIDHEEVLPLVDLGSGQFQATYATNVGGPARFRVEVVATEEYLDTWSDYHPGFPVELQANADGFAFPDGVSTVDVTVSPHDVEGNVVGPGFSTVEVSTGLSYDIDISNCDEYVYSFRSTKPGSFPVTFTETSSGLSQTIDVHFPVIGPLSPSTNPFLVVPGEAAVFTIPVAFHTPPDWKFSNAQIQVRLDAGMMEIGGLSGVSDGNSSDCLDLAGWDTEWDGDGNLLVTVDFKRNGGLAAPAVLSNAETLPPDEVPVPVCEESTESSFLLELTTNGGGEFGVQVSGNVAITSFTSDGVHPYYETTSVPTHGDGVFENNCHCIKKDYWEGCIIYVRAILPDGQSQPSESEICEEHDKINEIFGEHCITFTKNVTDIVLSDPEFLEDLDTDAEMDAVTEAALDAMTAAGIDRGNCLVIIHVAELGPKGATVAGAPGANPLNGTTIVEDGYFGNGRTNAHEVGHQLDQDSSTDDHAGTTPDNLMRPTDRGGTGTNLTPAQVTKYKMSDWLEMKTFEFYFCFPWFF